MIQLSFADSEFVQKRKITRKERFLTKIEKLVPWRRLIDVIEPITQNEATVVHLIRWKS